MVMPVLNNDEPLLLLALQHRKAVDRQWLPRPRPPRLNY